VDRKRKKLASAKAPLPKFRSDEQAAYHFESHSVADVWSELPEATPAKIVWQVGKRDSGTPCSGKVSDLNSIGPWADRRGKEIAAAKGFVVSLNERNSILTAICVVGGKTRSRAAGFTAQTFVYEHSQERLVTNAFALGDLPGLFQVLFG
jgi:hypothetical protein